MSPLWSRRPRRRELTSGRRTTPRTSLLRTSRTSRTGEIPGEPTPALEEEEQLRNSGLGTLRRLTSAAPERENPVRAMRKTSLQGREMFRKCQRTHCNTCVDQRADGQQSLGGCTWPVHPARLCDKSVVWNVEISDRFAGGNVVSDSQAIIKSSFSPAAHAQTVWLGLSTTLW